MKNPCLFTIALLLCLTLSAQPVFKSYATSVSQTLMGVNFYDTSLGYACGDAGACIKTTDGGRTWNLLNPGTAENLWDIRVIPGSSGQMLLMVGDKSTVLKSRNGGQDWTPLSIPFAAGSFVFGIHCLDSLNYFVCGGDLATFAGAVAKSTDGGKTWTKIAVPGSIFLDKLWMFDLLDGIAVGTNTSFSDGGIHGISNASASGTPVKTSSQIITNLWAINRQNIVAVGLNGQIWKSTDGGKNWTDKSLDNSDLYAVQFASPVNGFAAGGSNSGNSILFTTDGGGSWQKVNYTFTGSFKSMSMIGDKIFMVGTSGHFARATMPFKVGVGQVNIPAEVSLFPNPAIDRITIHCADEAQIKIFDAFGSLVLEAKLAIAGENLDISGLAGGIYNYEICDSGSIRTGKLVKY